MVNRHAAGVSGHPVVEFDLGSVFMAQWQLYLIGAARLTNRISRGRSFMVRSRLLPTVSER